ncbi:MAG: 4Fe-4S binding protein [Methanoregula sp.]|nr:MAG: 4Fe-4S binding protein [Methanoregula sp.]
MTRKIVFLFLFISAGLGFLIFSPMVPYQIQQAVTGGGPGPGTPLPLVTVLVVIFMVLTLVSGRIFCGQLCPIGAVQELIYTDPKQKTNTAQKQVIIVFRLIYFTILLIAGLLFSVSLIHFFGIKEFFYLDLNAPFFSVFVILIAISLFFYRPFCRLFCPFGVLLSLAAAKSLFKIRRTPACIECGRCEQVCPAAEAGADDGKMECYLCGRCTRACPTKGALEYSRETMSRVKKDEQ